MNSLSAKSIDCDKFSARDNGFDHCECVENGRFSTDNGVSVPIGLSSSRLDMYKFKGKTNCTISVNVETQM